MLVSASHAPNHRVHWRPSYPTPFAFPLSTVHTTACGSLPLVHGSHVLERFAQLVSVVEFFGFYYWFLVFFLLYFYLIWVIVSFSGRLLYLNLYWCFFFFFFFLCSFSFELFQCYTTSASFGLLLIPSEDLHK
jgi:hypothetical protein